MSSIEQLLEQEREGRRETLAVFYCLSMLVAGVCWWYGLLTWWLLLVAVFVGGLLMQTWIGTLLFLGLITWLVRGAQ